MKYCFIAEHRQEYPISTMCRVLEVSVSGFYAWLQRAPSRRSQENTRLGQCIVRIYHQNRQVYGSPRIHAALRTEGQRCGKKRVARLMRELGLSAKPRKHRTRTTDSQHEQPVAPNLLQREFTALARRQPAPDLLHHSDRGSQYTAVKYRELLAGYGVILSMSGKGDCYDNALMESFFGTLKTECVDRQSFATRQQARQAVFEYIEVFYNRQRLHSSLEYVSPVTHELQAK